MTTVTRISDLDPHHDAECSRELPYGSPGWRGLDPDNCRRCIGLVGLLDAARDKRLAAETLLKERIVGKLDHLPHRARGYTQAELCELVDGPAAGKRIRLQHPLRHLLEDKIIQEHVIQGVKRYTIKGR